MTYAALQFTVVNTPPNTDLPSERLSVLARILAGEPRSILGLVCAIASLFPEPVAELELAINWPEKVTSSSEVTWPSHLIGPLIREDGRKGTKVWTPEYGETFYLRPCLYKAFTLLPLRMEKDGKTPCRYDARKDDRDLQPAVDESFDYQFRRFRTSTAVILPVKQFGAACKASKRKRCVKKAKVVISSEKALQERIFAKASDHYKALRKWEGEKARTVAPDPLPWCLRTFDPPSIAPMTKEQLDTLRAKTYGSRLGRFANWCEECRVCYAREHSCRESSIERQIAADLLAAKREAKRKRLLAELASYQGLDWSDARDQEIRKERKRESSNSTFTRQCDVNLALNR